MINIKNYIRKINVPGGEMVIFVIYENTLFQA